MDQRGGSAVLRKQGGGVGRVSRGSKAAVGRHSAAWGDDEESEDISRELGTCRKIYKGRFCKSTDAQVFSVRREYMISVMTFIVNHRQAICDLSVDSSDCPCWEFNC